MRSIVNFCDDDLKAAFNELKDSKTEDQILYRWISRAIDDLEENAFCGTQIPKRLIPKEYVLKYGVDNLWKYNFPKGWRLVYSVAGGEVCIITIILDWFNHKDYEKRFRY